MNNRSRIIKRLLSDYGMLIILLLLCAYYSAATWTEQRPEGEEAARAVVEEIAGAHGDAAAVLVIAGPGDEAFAEAIRKSFASATIVRGEPYEVREAVERLGDRRFDAVATTHETSRWGLLSTLEGHRPPSLAGAEFVAPRSTSASNFLKRGNLLAVADRTVVIAIIAIGMTMVVITGGIDLSVGSIIAFSAVLATYLLKTSFGGAAASALAVVACCALALAACGVVGAFSGVMITEFAIPPFIVTLAMMMVVSGLAFLISAGQSIYDVPDCIAWLGRGASLFGIPNTVVLLGLLYLLGYLLMSKTVLGRHIYAVGGNREAARLSGVPVKRVLLFVYTVCGILAGVGGIIQASQLKSGAPTYGMTYELSVIAAVVVGGTSLAGGEGKILGTLIGAFIIAVIQNGMNLTGIESYTQKVVLGLVILGAVLLDTLKKRGWRRRRKGA